MTTGSDDAAVFTRLFDVHRDAVHAYFLGRVADPELARDLVQETFLRAWRRLSEVGPLPAEPAARLAVHRRPQPRDRQLPRRRRPPGRRGRPAPGTPRPGRRPWPGRTWRRSYGERLAQLEAAIRELPEDQRVILSMATAGGLTSRQIGEALGEPAGTVRYRLSQARKQLAAALDLEEDR